MEYILNYLINKSLIKKQDIQIIEYGLKSIVLNSATMISILIIVSYFHNFIFALYFLISFISIRTVSGGYHCHTPMRCFLSFNLILIFLFAINTSQIKLFHFYFLIVILFLIPSYVSTNKKHLKKNIFTNIKNIILLIHLIIIILLPNLYYPITISLLLNIGLLFTSYINDIYSKYIT